MSDTPQNDDAINGYVEEEVVTNDSVSESGTDNDAQSESIEQVDEVEVAKQKANDAFNKQYGEKKQLERELEAIRAKNAAFEQAERERQAAQVGDIPPMPDAFDDNYLELVKKRDEAIIANTTYNNNHNNYLQQQQYTQQQVVQAEQFKANKTLQDHRDRVKVLGINADIMLAAENAVLNYQLPKDLLLKIAGDINSPLIIQYLAGSSQDGFDLANMARTDSYGVGQFLDVIKQKASTLKPKTSNAPKPATNLSGNGADPELGKYKYLDGATFE